MNLVAGPKGTFSFRNALIPPGRTYGAWRADARRKNSNIVPYAAWFAAGGKGVDLKGFDTTGGWISTARKPNKQMIVRGPGKVLYLLK